MNKIKRFLASLLAATLAVMTPVMAFAAVEIPTVTFTNTSNDSPDLYVTKITQDEYGNTIDAGDTEFSFVIKVNDAFYKDEEYRVFNSEGEEVFLYENGESTDGDGTNKKTFKTEAYGDFTLKSGQTARFEWVGTGNSYEIYENATDGWTQLYPSGGDSATGTITATGNTVEFINVQSAGSSQLIVYKTTSFPDGYEAPETPEFTFNISLKDSGNPAPYEYTLRDIDSGRALDTLWTDRDGNFTLQGGQYAVFDVPQDVDYKVYEVTDDLPAGWRVTSSDSYEGTTGTKNSIVLNFNNATASFAVSKKVTDTAGLGYDSDHEFTFLLTDADCCVWPGVTYYLYHTNGTPYYDEDGSIQTGTTDENGYFTLKENQTAIFYGYEAGTGYNVSEVKESGFSQTVPNSADGYTDKVVSNTTEVLPFTNTPLNVTGNLVVTKTLAYTADEDGNILTPKDSGDEFYYILTKKTDEQATDDEGEPLYDDEGNPVYVYEPVAGAVYSVTIGSDTYTYKTDDEGKFKLNANTSALFEGLTVGETYRMEEYYNSGSYSFGSVTVTIGETFEEPITNVQYADGTLTSDGAAFDFVNVYNQEIPSTPRLPDTGGSGTLPYAMAGLTLVMTASGCLYYRRKHTNIFAKEADAKK